MKTINLNQIELNEFIGKEDKMQHCKATFPLIGVHGSQDLATVYFEIAPGDNLGRHTDSAEELLIILEGKLSARVGEEFSAVESGHIVLVPKMVPHDLRNTGTQKARVLGIFGGTNNIVATFDKEWLPTHSHIVDTAQL
jgi:quercetin dioxygenase-like cupin family protein